MLAATGFGAALGVFRGWQSSMEFASGYLVELSLSVDNLFVFVMLFEYFKVPSEYTQRVLTWGIGGAILMRGAMIVAGVAAVRRFRWMSLLFAGVLLLSSIKLLLESDNEDGELADNFVVRISRRLVGATSEYDGDRFFTDWAGNKSEDDESGQGRRRRRKRAATPLFLTLVCVELSDVVFAVDSIPAVLGISTDPFVVYSSNVFAIAGLRALYTLVARAVDSMVYLKPAVCLVLLFISLKMILEYYEYSLSTTFSLGVVVFILSGGAVLSILHKSPKRKDEPWQELVKRRTVSANPFYFTHRPSERPCSLALSNFPPIFGTLCLVYRSNVGHVWRGYEKPAASAHPGIVITTRSVLDRLRPCKNRSLKTLYGMLVSTQLCGALAGIAMAVRHYIIYLYLDWNIKVSRG